MALPGGSRHCVIRTSGSSIWTMGMADVGMCAPGIGNHQKSEIIETRDSLSLRLLISDLRSLIPSCRQPREPAQRDRRLPRRVLFVLQREFWQPLRQAPERDLALDPRQLRAQTMVDAAAERDRAHAGARDVEFFRVGIHLGIAVGGAEQAH